MRGMNTLRESKVEEGGRWTCVSERGLVFAVVFLRGMVVSCPVLACLLFVVFVLRAFFFGVDSALFVVTRTDGEKGAVGSVDWVWFYTAGIAAGVLSGRCCLELWASPPPVRGCSEENSSVYFLLLLLFSSKWETNSPTPAPRELTPSMTSK